MKKIFTGVIITFLVLITIILSPIIIIIFIMVFLIDKIHVRVKTKKWLLLNENELFIIYGKDNQKQEKIESLVLGEIFSPINTVIYNKQNYEGFIDNRVAKGLSLSNSKGFPILGKVSDGQVKLKFLAGSYNHLIKRNRKIKEFNNQINSIIEKL